MSKVRFSRPSTAPDFSKLVKNLATDGAWVAGPEPLGATNYKDELRWKTEAIRDFVETQRIGGRLLPIIGSPKARSYRTISRRRVFLTYDQFTLRFADASGSLRRNAVESLLDVPEHNLIYQSIANRLNTPAYSWLGEALRYVVLRGNYTEFMLLLNVSDFNAEIVRKLKLLTEHIRAEHPSIKSCFAYTDSSPYELEPDQHVEFNRKSKMKKLFGFESTRLHVADKTFFIPATSFLQVNESIVEKLISSVRDLLHPTGDERLIDLYCGCGVLSFSLAELYREVIGVDRDSAAIEAAKITLQKTKPKSRMKFIEAEIRAEFVRTTLPAPASNDVFLLDPTKGVVDAEIITAIAERDPRRVLHVFSDIDEVPQALKTWRQHNYESIAVQPIEAFPGTAGMEVCIVLERNAVTTIQKSHGTHRRN